jgi:tRNA1Val (adenine37-N6)-methyltransferase
MANNYFQFKQFIVRQDKAAMKVCTDACLFGAWAASKVENGKSKVENILDIGAGTGLLSLMLAQKTNAQIDAVEIDEDAALQAQENFSDSQWKERLALYKTPIQHFNPSCAYDVIVSNPPFFIQSLKSDLHQKNLAKHTESLSYDDLLVNALKLLKPKGKFFLLLPFEEFKRFETIAAQQLYLVEKTDVQQTTKHNFFRTMGVFTKQKSKEFIHKTISIKDEHHNYTPRFIELLKDYYLYL